MKHLKLYENFNIDHILDKISSTGMKSLSNHELTLLKSYSDENIDVKDEIEKHINKYKTAKGISTSFGLSVEDSDMESNIGRYVQYKEQKDNQLGMIVCKGAIYEIVGIQKHWGYVNDKYVRDKIGYRVALVGSDADFGRVADVDEINFVNYTEEDASKVNEFISENWALRGRTWDTTKRNFVNQTGLRF